MGFPWYRGSLLPLTVHWIPLSSHPPITIPRVLSLVYSPLLSFICPCCPYEGYLRTIHGVCFTLIIRLVVLGALYLVQLR